MKKFTKISIVAALFIGSVFTTISQVKNKVDVKADSYPEIIAHDGECYAMAWDCDSSQKELEEVE